METKEAMMWNRQEGLGRERFVHWDGTPNSSRQREVENPLQVALCAGKLRECNSDWGFTRSIRIISYCLFNNKSADMA